MKREWLAFLSAVQFLTRLPVPNPGWEEGRLDQAAKWFPLVGALVGAICGFAFFVIASLAIRGLPTTELAILVGVIVTGALHEDGLADSADGIGGGRDREKRLSIMRDSRIGSYGAIALIFCFLLRISLYSEFYRPTVSSVSYTTCMVAVFIAAHALSRMLMLLQIWALPYSRGAENAPISTLDPSGVAVASVTALIVAFPAASIIGVGAVSTGLLFAAVATVGLIALFKRTLGGWTGDTAGATQIIAEITFMIGLSTWIWS